MDLEIRCSIWRDGSKVAEQGDIVQIELTTEEIIIGILEMANSDSITIDRNGMNWTFEIEDIEDISRM